MKVDTRKIDIAKKILNKLVKELRNINDDYTAIYSVSFYKSGRENGYTIRKYCSNGNHKISVTFSENRNSDSYVVYYDIGIGKDIPSEEAYKNAKYFEGNDIEGCVNNCLFHLTEDK